MVNSTKDVPVYGASLLGAHVPAMAVAHRVPSGWRSDCDALLIRGREHPMRILPAIDGFQPSGEATNEVAQRLWPTPGTVRILWVIQPYVPPATEKSRDDWGGGRDKTSR